MSPREATQTVGAWWGALTTAEKAAKTLRAGFASVVAVAGGWVVISGFLSLPAQVDGLEAQAKVQATRDAAQDSAIHAIEVRAARGSERYQQNMEYVACTLRAIQKHTGEDCQQKAVDQQLTGREP